MRDRGLVIRAPTAKEQRQWSDEKRLRLHLILKQYRTLEAAWSQVTAETRRTMQGVPAKADTANGLDDFFLCYVAWLRLFKGTRKKEDQARLYTVSVRLKAYDWIFRMLLALERLHKMAMAVPEVAKDDFYDQLSSCAVSLGKTVGFCDQLAGDQLNATEYYLSAKADRERGAKMRHAENRGMKDQARNWYASNGRSFPSMDATAEALQRVVPVTFRTARAWVADFKAGSV